jgi:hypothetical protein
MTGWEVKKLRKTSKVVIAVALALVALGIAAQSVTMQANSARQATPTGQTTASGAPGTPAGTVATASDGCRDAAYQGSMFDLISGAPCPYASP